jgi:hypothetical protein
VVTSAPITYVSPIAKQYAPTTAQFSASIPIVSSYCFFDTTRQGGAAWRRGFVVKPPMMVQT